MVKRILTGIIGLPIVLVILVVFFTLVVISFVLWCGVYTLGITNKSYLEFLSS